MPVAAIPDRMSITAYLINLDRSPDRLVRMQARFDEVGAAFVRIPAVDGKALNDAARKAACVPHKAWLPLTASEIGCFLSHRACWRQIADGPAPYGCVFEDDMLLAPRLQDFLADRSWIPADAEIVKIEEGHNRVWLDMPLRDVKNGVRLGRLRSTHYRAGAYIVSRDAARRLLVMTERFGLPVDLFLFDAAVGEPSCFVIYQLLPALAEQEKGAALEVKGGGGTIARSGFRREDEFARQRRRYADELRKLWHRLRGRQRMAVGFDGSES
jgi:glycosyl transferase family 25